MPGETFLPLISSVGKSESTLSGDLASPAVQGTAKEAHFSLIPSRVLSRELHNLEVGELQITLKYIKGTQSC